jgi:ACR3 family arsenite efflux pump ArsB
MLFVYGFIPASRQFMAPLYIIARVVGLLLIWYLILAPFLMRILQRFLDKKASDYREDVVCCTEFTTGFQRAWSNLPGGKRSHLSVGWKRWEALVIRIITYVLVYSYLKKINAYLMDTPGYLDFFTSYSFRQDYCLDAMG